MLGRVCFLGLSILMTSFIAGASEVTKPTYSADARSVVRDKLVGIYATFQLRDAVILGCSRLDNSISTDVSGAFDTYSKLARNYILEGKRLLDEELSPVEKMEWIASMDNAKQHYQMKFSQLTMTELKTECQQVARQMAKINKQVIILKSQ